MNLAKIYIFRVHDSEDDDWPVQLNGQTIDSRFRCCHPLSRDSSERVWFGTAVLEVSSVVCTIISRRRREQTNRNYKNKLILCWCEWRINSSHTIFVTRFSATFGWPSTMGYVWLCVCVCRRRKKRIAVHINHSCLQIVLKPLIGIRCWVFLLFCVAHRYFQFVFLGAVRNQRIEMHRVRLHRGATWARACRSHVDCVKQVNSFRVNECVWFGPPLAETRMKKKKQKKKKKNEKAEIGKRSNGEHNARNGYLAFGSNRTTNRIRAIARYLSARPMAARFRAMKSRNEKPN